MTSIAPPRPQADEFAPYYARYVDRVPDGDVVAYLRTQREELRALLASIPESRGGHRYAEGKWSVREVVGHIADTERVMSYRALRFGRGDETPVPGFDEGPYVAHSGHDRRTLASLAAEFDTVRAATIALLEHYGEEELSRRGTASGYGVTVRGVAYIIAGHALHHMAGLRDNYGVG
jgi:hypothetical protein